MLPKGQAVQAETAGQLVQCLEYLSLTDLSRNEIGLHPTGQRPGLILFLHMEMAHVE